MLCATYIALRRCHHSVKVPTMEYLRYLGFKIFRKPHRIFRHTYGFRRNRVRAEWHTAHWALSHAPLHLLYFLNSQPCLWQQSGSYFFTALCLVARPISTLGGGEKKGTGWVYLRCVVIFIAWATILSFLFLFLSL